MGLIKGLNQANSSTESSTRASVSSLFSLNINIPVGSILPYVNSTPPTGFLLCDGVSLNTYSYKELHAVISNNFGGTAYQAGVTDQSGVATTFNLPNFVTSSVFPIGLDSSNTKINSIGKSGGSLDHTHNAPEHEHTFTHSHTVASHNHGYDHTHGMANHTHNTNHRHSQSHYHSLPAHGHANISLNVSLPNVEDHYHDISGRYSDAGGSSQIGRGMSGVWYPDGNRNIIAYADINNNPSTHTDYISLGASTVGYYYGTDASVNSLITPSDSTATSENDAGSSIPSTNATSSVTNIGSYTLSSSATTTSTQSHSVTSTTGSLLTTNSSNPPYLTINFMIKVSDG